MVAEGVIPSRRMRSCGVHGGFSPPVRAALLVASAALVLGCRPDPPLPPDPDEPTPASSCDDHPALSLTRVEADSIGDDPSWFQVCAQCPVAEVTWTVGDGAGGVLPVESIWTPGRQCAVAAPVTPSAAVPSLPVSVTVRDGEREGTFAFDHELSGDRGQDPVDLGSATWVLPIDAATTRVRGGLDLIEDPPFALALHLSAADAQGDRVLTLGGARDDGARQDLCVPTTELAVPASLLLRQVAAPISAEDTLPGGLLARRGALQARLSETGDALQDVVLVALADLAASESILGAPPAEVCAAWTDADGTSPCVPCGSPSEGIAGLPACVPFVLEWSLGERADWSLQPVDPEHIPIGCRFIPGDDDDSAGT